MPNDLTFKISGEARDLIRVLQDAQREVERTAQGGASARGAAAAAGTTKVTQALAQEARAVEQHYAGVARTATNAIKSIPVPGLGTVGGLAGIAGVSFAVQKATGDYIELANVTKQLAIESGATTERMSTMIGVAAQLHIGTDALSSAFRGVKTAMETEEGQRQLEALGVAFKDVDGNARPVIDVFDDLHKKFASAKMDAGTLQVAQQLLGRDYREALPLLALSAAAYAEMAQRVRELGEVMDDTGIAKAKAYELQMHEVNIVLRQFGQVAVPIATGALQGLGQVFDTLGTAARNFWTALGGKEGQGSINPFDAIDEAQKRHNDQAQRNADAAKAIVDAGKTGGGAESLGFASQEKAAAATQAIQDQIKAVQDLAAEEERRLRRALDGYDKERQTAIDTINAEQAARSKQHDAELRAIDDELRARQDAFDARDRLRSDEIGALQEEIRATGELLNLEQDRKAIADAEAGLRTAQGVTVYRNAYRTALDYYTAVTGQQQRVRDAEQKLADAKKKLDQDVARSAIEARIRALQQEGELEKRALADYKRDAEIRLQAIRDQMAKEKEQADTRIAQLQAEMKAEQERVKDAIEKLQDETRVTIAELQKRLSAHLQTAGAVTAAWNAAAEAALAAANASALASSVVGGNVTKNPDATDRNRGADSGANVTVYSGAQLQALALQYLGRKLEPDELARHLADRRGQLIANVAHDYRESPEGFTHELIQRANSVATGVLHDSAHDYTYTEPTLTLGLRSGSVGGIAMGGPEPVTFHGVGGARGRGGVSVSFGDIVVAGETLTEARRQAIAVVGQKFQDLEELMAGDISRGGA